MKAPMGYSVDELKKNRVSTLVYGGTEADRRALATTAAAELGGAPLLEAKDDAGVQEALSSARSVVYVPDAAALSPGAQRGVVRVLRELEERPKLVLGLSTTPETAAQKGLLTEDLRYWLSNATVDVKSRGSRR